MEDRPFLITAREKKDRSILTTVIACFLVALVVGVGLSYFSSRHADQMAASSGSSTRSDGPNTLQDQSEKRPPATTTGSNVPPAGR